MVELIRRRFGVGVSVHRAWDHLARVENWPTWAGHIKLVTLDPPGILTSTSCGIIHLRNGIKSRFAMTQFAEHRHWEWSGPFLWLRIHYDHRFESTGPQRTELEWIVRAEGCCASVMGRLVAVIYNRNLNKAIPRLVREMELTG